jgi:hypothetical protein
LHMTSAALLRARDRLACEIRNNLVTARKQTARMARRALHTPHERVEALVECGGGLAEERDPRLVGLQSIISIAHG